MEILITNRLAEGTVTSIWVELPCTGDEFDEALNSIGIRDIDDENWFISKVQDTDLDYAPILRIRPSLSDLNEWAYCEENYSDVARAISEVDGIHNVDRHECRNRTFLYGVNDTDELGHRIVDEGFFPCEIPSELEDYLDYERIGMSWEEEGNYSSEGFLMNW